MAMYEVDYEYPVIEEDMVLVEADSIEQAEQVALDKLSDELPQEIDELAIQAIREVKTNV